MAKLFEGARQNKKHVLKSIGLGLLFWLIQFFYQYVTTGSVSTSMISGSAFTGATLISLALLTGPLSRIFPKYNYVRHRRTLGVLGFTFGIIHVISVFTYVAGFNFSVLFPTLDPFLNPLVFGLLAFLLYLPLYVTSTDWANQKLGFKAWKTIHRIVYLAWILTVLHFVTVNTLALMTPPGYLLLLVTGLVFAFELAAFVTWPRRGKNTIAGIIIIIFGALLFYKASSVAIDNTIKYGAVFVVVVAIILVMWKKLSGRKSAPPAPQAPVAPAPEQIVQN